MTDAIVTLALLASAILLGFFCEWLVKDRRVDLDLARRMATNDAQIRFSVEHINRDMLERAARYREAHHG